MKAPTPIDAVQQLVDARNRGDIETALGFYEPDATLVAQPGTVVRGVQALRESLARFHALHGSFESSHEIVEAGDIALHCAKWSLRGTDPSGRPVHINGGSADVLRRQPDGHWLIALDNPWGAQIAG